MAECGFDRPLLEAWLDGECAAEERSRVEAHLRSCQVCLDYVTGAAWEVGLFLLNDPGAGGPASAPSAEFTERVMRRVRTEPRTEPVTEMPARGAPPPIRVLPPSPAAPPAPARGRVLLAGFAAVGALAAAAVLLLLTRGQDHVPTFEKPEDMGRGVATARVGGVLRWPGPFDGSLAGSVWIAKDDSTPTLPGEVLHSPVPSGIHMRLPEGGRLDAGPSSWVGVGREDTIAVLEGGVTACAAPDSASGPGAPLRIALPGVVVTTKGEVEVSVRPAGGAGSAGAARWLGTWAAARTTEPAPGTEAGAAEPPKAALLIYARRGDAEVASSRGPVRNSLERQKIPQGEALVILETKVFRTRGVDDDAPPEKAGWIRGMPVPPGSEFFRDAAKPGPAPAPEGFGASGGPVRNSLERVIDEAREDAEKRAYALSVFGSVGGVEAVEAAAKAASDPAVLVRSAAVRILALNAWADRPRALEALRTLARDRDAGVARYAILALKTLEDREAIPLLRSIVVDDDAPPEPAPGPGPAVVDDDAPPEKPVKGPPPLAAPVAYPEVAKVYAFDALVHFGDNSTLLQAAALEPKVEGDRALSKALRDAVTRAFQGLDFEVIQGHVGSPQPGVRAAAIRALQDPSICKAALQDPSEAVRIAACETLLLGRGKPDFESWTPVVEGSLEYRARLVRAVAIGLLRERETPTPAWVIPMAKALLESRQLGYVDAGFCAQLLTRAGEETFLESLVTGAEDVTAAATLTNGPLVPDRVLKGLRSTNPLFRRLCAVQLRRLANGPEDVANTEQILGALSNFQPMSLREAIFKAQGLSALFTQRGSVEALAALLEMARADDVVTRRGAVLALGSVASQTKATDVLVASLADPDRGVALRAADTVFAAAQRPDWAGPPVETLFPCASPHGIARATVAVFAWTRGLNGSEEAVVAELVKASSETRQKILQTISQYDLTLSRLDGSVLEDPSSSVRLMALLRLAGEPAREWARRLADDPAAWVRGTALALLAQGGDADAETRLRELLATAPRITSADTEFAMAARPDDPEIASSFLSSAQFQGSVGGTAEAVFSPGQVLNVEALRLQSLAVALRFGDRLRNATDSTERVMCARELGRVDTVDALDPLAAASDPQIEKDAEVRESSLDSFCGNIGFTPIGGPASFLAHHRPAVFSPIEIRLALNKR